MENNEQRIEEFKQEVAELKLRTPDDANERRWLLGGLLLPVIGIVVIIVGWVGASGESQTSGQIPYVISGGLLGVGLIVAGGALFVRYSMTRYLRFWLLRLIYEDRTQTDRVVDSLERVEALLRTSQSRSRANVD